MEKLKGPVRFVLSVKPMFLALLPLRCAFYVDLVDPFALCHRGLPPPPPATFLSGVSV
jgi:hypothetical protein